MSNLLEPWVLLPVAASMVSTALVVRAAYTSVRVARRFDLRSATEGQLALERQVELASTFVRVAFAVDVAALALFILSADKLSHAIRGAMCGYGVFESNEHGFRALAAGVAATIALGWLHQLHAFDARSRGLDHVRALSLLTLLAAPLVVARTALVVLFLTRLDLTVVASCCSVTLDADAARGGSFAHGPRQAAVVAASLAAALAAGVASWTARRPTRARTILAGVVAFASLPPALAAIVLEVAPHVFETPHHVCPFCLFRPDAWGLGYPLFGALLAAIVVAGGAAGAAVLARGRASEEAFRAFAPARLRASAIAWAAALALGLVPVVRYAIVTGGASLFR